MPEAPLNAEQLGGELTDIPPHQWEGREPPAEPTPRRRPILLDRQSVEREPDVLVKPSMPSGVSAVRPRPQIFEMPKSRVVWRGMDLTPFAGIFPPDGRRPYFDLTYPWRCVCRVQNRKRGCGVLVGSHHVLTASHVIDWDGPMETVLFAQSGVVLATATATDVIAFDRVDDGTWDNADDDYAVIVLDRPIGSRLGWFGSRTYDSSWDDETDVWCNIAHAPDIGAAVPPVFQTNFFLDDEELDLGGGRALKSETIDLVRGMSGSPIFGFWSDGPYVVGVVSAGATGGLDANILAAGSNLPKLVSKAQAMFP